MKEIQTVFAALCHKQANDHCAEGSDDSGGLKAYTAHCERCKEEEDCNAEGYDRACMDKCEERLQALCEREAKENCVATEQCVQAVTAQQCFFGKFVARNSGI